MTFPTALEAAADFPYVRPHGEQTPDGVAPGDMLLALRDSVIAIEAVVGITGGDARKRTLATDIFNIDNGAGVTRDFVWSFPYAITVRAVRRVYMGDATAGTVASATTKVGTTLGGEEIVAAVACTNSAARGDSEDLTIVSGAVAAGGKVFVRHTGIAVTVAGEYAVEIDYTID